MADELNFARVILDGRSHRDIPDEEVLERSRELLEEWMNGESRLERPKLYDHYAMLLVALVRRVQTLEERVRDLEGNG